MWLRRCGCGAGLAQCWRPPSFAGCLAGSWGQFPRGFGRESCVSGCASKTPPRHACWLVGSAGGRGRLPWCTCLRVVGQTAVLSSTITVHTPRGRRPPAGARTQSQRPTQPHLHVTHTRAHTDTRTLRGIPLRTGSEQLVLLARPLSDGATERQDATKQPRPEVCTVVSWYQGRRMMGGAGGYRAV